MIARLVIGIAGLIANVVSLIRNTTRKAAHLTQKTGSNIEADFSPAIGKILTNTGKVMYWIADHLLIAVGVLVLLIFGIIRR